MNKKIKIILLILILILLVLIISSTFSKYTAEADAVINRDIASWIIKVNDKDITVKQKDEIDENPIIFDITGNDVKWDENIHTVGEKITPGMKGYFYLRIDPEGTQTALKYTINVDIKSILDEHLNFVVNKISEENGKEIKLKDDGKKFTVQRIKSLDEIKSDDIKTRIDTIKVEIQWVDDDAFNDFDTKVGETFNKKFKIPVDVNVIQYTGQGYDI